MLAHSAPQQLHRRPPSTARLGGNGEVAGSLCRVWKDLAFLPGGSGEQTKAGEVRGSIDTDAHTVLPKAVKCLGTLGYNVEGQGIKFTGCAVSSGSLRSPGEGLYRGSWRTREGKEDLPRGVNPMASETTGLPSLPAGSQPPEPHPTNLCEQCHQPVRHDALPHGRHEPSTDRTRGHLGYFSRWLVPLLTHSQPFTGSLHHGALPCICPSRQHSSLPLASLPSAVKCKCRWETWVLWRSMALE